MIPFLKLTKEIAQRIHMRQAGKREHYWQYDRQFFAYECLRLCWQIRQDFKRNQEIRRKTS